jgi:hypothetical protein
VSAALVLLVLVVKGEEGSATAAMSKAVRDAVLIDAQVELREVARFPKDEEVVALAKDAHANAVVEIVWKDATHRNVTLHFHANGASTWNDRHLAFEATDFDADRGRTIGFAVVSMLPETLTRPPPPLPQEPKPPEPEPPPPPPPAEKKREWRPEDFVPERRLGALDLAGAMRLGDNVTGWGAELSGRWDFTGRFSARLVGAVHAGDVSAANASSLVAELGAGLVGRPILASRARPFEVSIRADFLVQRIGLGHGTADGATLSEARWQPAADLAVDGMWLFSGNLGLFAAIGGEVAFGTTAVFVKGEEVASISPVRAVGNLGIRVFF